MWVEDRRLNLDIFLDALPEPSDWERDLASRLRDCLPWREFLPIAAWEFQSRLATVVLLGLVSFASIWIALPIMLAWSLCATIVYFLARRNGFPDLLEPCFARSTAKRFSAHWLGICTLSWVKAWFVGIQSMIYSRSVRRVLACPAQGIRSRVMRFAVLTVGLTLFGVASTQHLLSKAGLPESRVLQVSVVGSFLNVPYRLLLSAMVIDGLVHVVHLVGMPHAIV